MKKQHEYAAGIDIFRFIAAFLIIAIHTGPFSSYSNTVDFYVTYCLGRIGVPFFYMVTGYFVLSGYQKKNYGQRVRLIIKKLTVIYLGMTVLYLPLSWYTGNLPDGIGAVLRWILFDGTFYHLWYLPGAVIGSLMVALMLRGSVMRSKAVSRSGKGRIEHVHMIAIAVMTLLLYLVGVFGDSWYGAAEKISVAENFYEGVFTIASYTRNGIFFAPVFLLMGALLAEYRISCPLIWVWLGFGSSLLLMMAEGGISYHLGWQRHNSMYLFLVPVMLFLFEGLLRVPGYVPSVIRGMSMWIYLLHPLWITLIHKFLSLAGLKEVLFKQSLLFYLSVCVLSGTTAVPLAWLVQKMAVSRRTSEAEKIQKPEAENSQLSKAENSRAWIELNLNHLRHNVEFFQGRLSPNCALMPAVKANAYGHGVVPVTKALQESGIYDFCVATVWEGIRLRETGIQGQILVLGYTEQEQLSKLAAWHLTQTVIDADYVRVLKTAGKPLRVHVGIDTGMHRLGLNWEDMSTIAELWSCGFLEITGVFSHLCAADGLQPKEIEFTKMQIERFSQVVTALHERGILGFRTHLFGSYGIIHYPEKDYDYARVGIALYGVLSRQEDCPGKQIDIKPVLSLKARVICVRKLKAGESAGYGLAYTAPKDVRIAILSIGYADGIPRNMSGRGYVLCHGKRAPMIGRICMDQMLVDVTEIEAVKPQDIAVLIGRSKAEEIRTEDLAGWSDTISNEILSRLGQRLVRSIVE